MKQCKRMSFQISRYIDGDCSSDETHELETHLSHCEQCKQTYQTFKLQKELIAASFSDKPLPESVAAMVQQGSAGKKYGHYYPILRYGIVSMVLVLVGITWIGLQLHRGSSSESVLSPIVILESTGPGTMSSPLSSLAYYEELAGDYIHSQFITISPINNTVNTNNEEEGVSTTSYYESPIFYDDLNSVQVMNTISSYDTKD